MKKRILQGIGIIAGLLAAGMLMSCSKQAETKNVPDAAGSGAPEAGANTADAEQMPEASDGGVMAIYGPMEGAEPVYDGAGNVAPEEGTPVGQPEMLEQEDGEADMNELKQIPEHEMIQALYGVSEPSLER
ncbi:MAG: hypothetical protein II180_10105 [Proteobacteria bacterium]|nr:hypothetical protein [Pseudomonadota bacterium]